MTFRQIKIAAMLEERMAEIGKDRYHCNIRELAEKNELYEDMVIVTTQDKQQSAMYLKGATFKNVYEDFISQPDDL